MSRIPNKSESFKKDYTIETYIIKDETGETKEYRLIDKNCNVIAKLVEKDGEFNESSATTDAQNSGLFEDFAKKFGFKDDIQFTTMQSRIENIEELKKSMASRLKKAINSRLAKGDVVDMFNRKKKDVDTRSKDDKIKEALKAQGNRGKNKERSMEDLKREAQSRQIPKDAKYISSHDPVYGEHHSDGHNPNHINFYLANHLDDKTSGIHATMPDGSNFDDEAYNHIESGDFDSYIDEAQSNGFQSIILHPNDDTAYSGRNRESAMKLFGTDKDLNKGYTPESIEKLKDEYRPEDPKITFVKKIKKIKENNKPKDTSDAALERKVRERYDLSKDDNTLDYSKLNNPQGNQKKEAPSLDYSKMSSPAPQPPRWKRDLEVKRSAQQKVLDAQGKTKEAPRQKTAIEEIREKRNLNKSLELLQKLAKSKRLAKGDVIDLKSRKDKLKNKESGPVRERKDIKSFKENTKDSVALDRKRNNEKILRGLERDRANAKDKANQDSRRSPKYNPNENPHMFEVDMPSEQRSMKRKYEESYANKEQNRKDALLGKFNSYIDQNSQAEDHHKKNLSNILMRFSDKHPDIENNPFIEAWHTAKEKNVPYHRTSDGSRFPVPNYDAKPTGQIGDKREIFNYGGDPFMWADHKHGAGRKLLQEHRGMPLEIHTVSDLLAQDDYAQDIPKGAKINMYLHGRGRDTHMPSDQRISQAAEKLKQLGHDVKLHPAPVKLDQKGVLDKSSLRKSMTSRLKKAISSKLSKGDVTDIRTGNPLESKEEKMARVKQKLKNLQVAMARVKMATGDVKTVDHQEMKDYRPKDDLSKGDVVNMFDRKGVSDTRTKDDKINDALKTHGIGQSSSVDINRANNINASLSRIKELMATKKERMAARSEEFRKKREAASGDNMLKKDMKVPIRD